MRNLTTTALGPGCRLERAAPVPPCANEIASPCGSGILRGTGFTTRVVNSLASYTDEQLDQATLEANIFFDRRWFRMLDEIELAPLLGGQATLRYMVVSRGDQVAAVCPFIVTRSTSIHHFYSLEKYYFTAWSDELLQLHPDKANYTRWVMRLVNAYLGLAHRTGVQTQGWVLAVSPLSYYSDVAVAPDGTELEDAARAQAVRALQEVARDEDLPLSFLGVSEEQQALRTNLAKHSFTELFLTFDNLLELPMSNLAQYVDSLPSKARQRVRHERTAVEKNGVRFEQASDLDTLQAALERMYETVYSKYGADHFRHPAPFWPVLGRHLGFHAQTFVAYRGDEPIGFSTFLQKNGQWHGWRCGRAPGTDLDKNVYFNLAFYEPIQRALELDATRLLSGPGGWSTKARRGAVPHALHSHIWFPRRWPRVLLQPYLKKFGELSMQEQTQAMRTKSA
jgi:predicted N-acyltransferase